MRQSRIKKLRKAAKTLAFAAPNLNQQQKVKVYQGAIETIKKSAHHQGTSPKEWVKTSKKMKPGESLMDFQERRKICNQKRREREKNESHLY